MTKIGVIGVGEMGSAIIKGLKKDATNKNNWRKSS